MISNNDSSKKNEHTHDLRVAYLEGLLDPEERVRVEEHLKSCPQCAAELEETRQWMNLLTKNQEVFCPEPWEIFDQVRRQAGQAEDVCAHLEACPSCRKTEQSFRAMASSATMPEELWERMQHRSRQPRSLRVEARLAQWISELMETAADFFRVPVLATAAAVAAAVLVVLVMYPSRVMHPVIALSSTQWESSFLQRLFMGGGEPSAERDAAPRERLAIVLELVGMEHPMPQQQVNSLYDRIGPSQDMLDRYEVMTPKEVNDAVASGKVETASTSRFLEGLHQTLGVSKVIMITLLKKGERFDIESQLQDANTGKVLRQVRFKEVTPEDLGSTLEKANLALLCSREN